jgi:putative heme-binding domain-containing protein
MIRYSARLALENQPVSTWKQQALAEKDPVASTQALISLIRSADASAKNDVLKSLNQIDISKLNSSQKQDIFRAYELLISRYGDIEGKERVQLISSLDKFYPSKSPEENRLLCKLLVSLEAPNVITKTLALMERTDENVNETVATQSEDLILRNPSYGLDIAKYLEKMPQAQHTFYAIMLAKAKQNWTPAQQETYFGWYQKAFKMKGGNSYVGFIDRARKMALANVNSDKRKYFDELSGGNLLTQSGNDIKDDDYPKGPGRNYKMEDVDKIFAGSLTNRDFNRGKAMFNTTTCARCHAMNGEGGNIGPDLTQVGTRFSTKDLLESIINPSKAISDQYATTEFQMKNGASIIGKINNQDDKFYYVAQNPYTPDFVVKVDKKKVVNMQYSAVSSMLPGLINGLNAEELKDLVAYLQAGGKDDNLMFKK